VCRPKHVEQLRNIGIINSTTRSHLVGSFYNRNRHCLLWKANKSTTNCERNNILFMYGSSSKFSLLHKVWKHGVAFKGTAEVSCLHVAELWQREKRSSLVPNLGKNGGEWLSSCLGRFTLGKTAPGVVWIESCMDSNPGWIFWREENALASGEIEPRFPIHPSHSIVTISPALSRILYRMSFRRILFKVSSARWSSESRSAM
jgi:hypothetical protein